MAHVILLVNAAGANKINLRWSDGAGCFDPYHLGRVESREFWGHVADARSELKRMADLYLTWVDPNEQGRREQSESELQRAWGKLALSGHRLYCDLFQTRSDRRPEMARKAEEWLRQLRPNDVETLEVVVEEGEFSVPWTVVYDEDPAGRSFPFDRVAGRPALDDCGPFWGLRYRLGSGKRVDPLRRTSAPSSPRLVVVIDPDTYDNLGNEEKRRLDEFCRGRSVVPCTTLGQIETRLAPGQGRAHLLYW